MNGMAETIRRIWPQNQLLAYLLGGFLALALVSGLIWINHTYLDPGGRGFAGEANDKCRGHDGVRWLNAQQGTIICRDGWAVE
jgi:hypothetical protein